MGAWSFGSVSSLYEGNELVSIGTNAKMIEGKLMFMTIVTRHQLRSLPNKKDFPKLKLAGCSLGHTFHWKIGEMARRISSFQARFCPYFPSPTICVPSQHLRQRNDTE